MNTNDKPQYGPPDPWRDEGQIFRAVGVVVLIIFVGFVVYDGRQSYVRYMKRCVQTPERPDCKFSRVAKPMPTPEPWILDQGSGKWAIQLEAMDEKTANDNVRRLKEAGVTPRVIKINGRKRVVLHYLQLGRFKTQKAARETAGQLRAKGLLKSFTVSPYRPT